MGDIEIRGGAEAARIATAFEKAAVRGLKRELQAGLTKATRPMKDAAKERARDTLPKKNGLNDLVARSRMTTRQVGGGDPAVRIVATGMDQIELIDSKGIVVHPTFGHKPRVVQAVTAAEGWFTEAMEDSAPLVRMELADAIDKVARNLEAAAGG